MKTIILLFCSRNIKSIMERRSKDLGISIPDYLKYIVVKENEEIELLRSKAIKK